MFVKLNQRTMSKKVTLEDLLFNIATGNPKTMNQIFPPAPEREREIESFMWDGIYVKLMSWEQYERLLTPMEICWFCWKHGIYQLPTIELIEQIKLYLIGKKILPSECIEIGAGTGQIGRHLGIRMTDNKLQDEPEIREHYAAMGQPVLKYSPDVEKIDANSAVIKYKPRVVLACWVTETPKLVFGVKEPEMLKHIERYFFVGNLQTHGDKSIFHKVSGEYYPWLISRSFHPQDNRIWIVNGGRY
jgi:hypothetical protein